MFTYFTAVWGWTPLLFPLLTTPTQKIQSWKNKMNSLSIPTFSFTINMIESHNRVTTTPELEMLCGKSRALWHNPAKGIYIIKPNEPGWRPGSCWMRPAPPAAARRCQQRGQLASSGVSEAACSALTIINTVTMCLSGSGWWCKVTFHSSGFSALNASFKLLPMNNFWCCPVFVMKVIFKLQLMASHRILELPSI